ncbi:hypothetical protein GCM10025868_20780 [Angustibacter aerolatus]|uniref:DUF222 domain-containing protein n=1 Tax=Angustibacter aerolatus TaxID=1162965 RepID=A0ABQ6JF61_9ACTN|nr:hypothetical protein GCM10025868_20780 [Angustibacter aerolatus]
MLAEVERSGLVGRDGQAGLATWLREQVPSMTVAAAARTVQRVHRLFTRPIAADLGPTREALLAGDVDGEQADVVVQAVETLRSRGRALDTPADRLDAVLVEAQDALLRLARGGLVDAGAADGESAVMPLSPREPAGRRDAARADRRPGGRPRASSARSSGSTPHGGSTCPRAPTGWSASTAC